MYRFGQGVPQDYAQAVQWYRKAADQGDADAQSTLGLMYRRGEESPRMMPRRCSGTGRRRTKGMRRPSSTSASCTTTVKESPRPDAQAVQWYRKAADQGHAGAQDSLGYSYGSGQGVPQDSTEAVKWFRKARGTGICTPCVRIDVAFIRERKTRGRERLVNENSQELRERVTRKVLEGTRSQGLVAEEFGIGRSTIQNWLRQDRRAGVSEVVKQERRPEDWTAQERLNALIESSALSEDALGAWCRGQGLHTHHLERWRREIIEGQDRGKGSQSTLRALREETRSLKKELRRKEKALAETAALLVLKKKRPRFGGSPRTID